MAGRKRVYSSNAERQKAYRLRKGKSVTKRTYIAKGADPSVPPKTHCRHGLYYCRQCHEGTQK